MEYIHVRGKSSLDYVGKLNLQKSEPTVCVTGDLSIEHSTDVNRNRKKQIRVSYIVQPNFEHDCRLVEVEDGKEMSNWWECTSCNVALCLSKKKELFRCISQIKIPFNVQWC